MSDSSSPVWLAAPRFRVMLDNDYSGDPDGLVQLAQHALSPSIDIRAVIGSRCAPHELLGSVLDLADRSVTAARTVLELSHRTDIPVVAGSNVPLGDEGQPLRTAATEAIIAEAMRDDTELPLFLACGGGLTEVASAWLIEPRIAERLTLVWIGGQEHDGLGEPPPSASVVEYNLGVDPVAARIVFNDSDLPIWQVPRNTYRSIMVSNTELLVRMRPHGALGEHLFDSLADGIKVAFDFGFLLGETQNLGDSALVLLTALLTPFDPSAASSSYVTMPCPRLDASGLYEPNPTGRPLRVYTELDTRLLLEDLYAKLEIHAAR